MIFERGAGLGHARKNMQLSRVLFGEQKDGKETYNIYTVVSMSFQHGVLSDPGHAKRTWQFCIPILKQGKKSLGGCRSFRKEAGVKFISWRFGVMPMYSFDFGAGSRT
jgi:hypothetical protein